MKRRKGDVLVIAVMVSAFLCGAISYAIARMFGVSTMAVNSYNRNLQARQYALNISEEVSVLDFDGIVEKKTDKLERIAGSNYYKMVDITTDLTVVPNVRKANINVYHKDDLANAVSSVVVTKYSENEKDVLYSSAGSHTDNSITEEALYTTYLPKKDAVFASGKVGSEINPIYVDKDGNLKPTDIEFRNQYNTAAKKLAVWNGNEINYMNANDIAVPIGGAGSVSTNSYIKFPNGLIFNFGHGAYYDNKPVPFKTLISNHIATVYDIPTGIRYGKWRTDFVSDKMNLYGGFVNSMYWFTVGAPVDNNGAVQNTIFFAEGGRNHATSYLDVIHYNEYGNPVTTTYTLGTYGYEWGRSISSRTIVLQDNAVFRFRLYPAQYYSNSSSPVRFYNPTDGWQDCNRTKKDGYDEFSGYIKGYTTLSIPNAVITGTPEWCTVTLLPCDNIPGVEYPTGYVTSYTTNKDGSATSIGFGESFKVIKGSKVRFNLHCDYEHRLLGHYVNGVYTKYPDTSNYFYLNGSSDGSAYTVNGDMTFKAGAIGLTNLGKYDAD